MRKTAITIAATVLTALFIITPAASAGTYTISQCDARTGSALPGWTTLTSGWAAASSCPKNLKFTTGKAGKWAILRTPKLPSELGIARVSFLASGLRTPDARPYGGFCKNYPANKPCQRQITRRAAKRSRETHTNEFVWHPHGNKPGAKAFEVGVHATAGGKAVASTAYLNARHFKFTLNDNTVPQLAIENSGAPTAGWASGVFNVTVKGSDFGGGVAGFWLDATNAADAAASRHLSTKCDYTAWQPCPQSTSRTFAINTADFSSGNASLTFSSEDAAGNRSASKTVSFKVDNVAPPKPGAVTYQYGDCDAADVSWSYPTTGDDGSPFVGLRVTYALTDWSYPVDHKITTTGDEQSVDLPFGNTEGFGDVSLSGITAMRLPSPHPNANEYVVLISVRDEAGNVSDPTVLYVNSDNCPS